jgi:hypothetical protein
MLVFTCTGMSIPGFSFTRSASAAYEEGMMVGYKGYLIVGHVLRVHPTSSDWWRSQGNVFTDTVEGTILATSLEGVIFESQRAAQDHGVGTVQRVGGPGTEGQEIEVKAMTCKHGGADFQSRFDKSTAQAEQMKAGVLRVV